MSGSDSAPSSWVSRIPRAVFGPLTRDNLWGWLRIVALLLFLKGCVIDQYTIPSGSMEPTLMGHPNMLRGDRVLVNKWLYGPRLPFTTWRPWRWGAPERWDIVVFRSVEENPEHSTLIKRVVGLPGETVRIHGGQVYIDGDPAPLPEDLAELRYESGEDRVVRLLNARDDEERLWAALVHEQYPLRYGVLPVPPYDRAPEDHYFVLGDNSRFSVDGRVYGWVPHDHLYGRAFAVWWPLAHRRDFTGFSSTWWGMALLYGAPLLLLGHEVWRYARRRREHGAASA